VGGDTPGCRISRTLRPSIFRRVIVRDYSEVIPKLLTSSYARHPPTFLDVGVADERDTIEWVAVLIACRNAVGDWLIYIGK